MGTPTLQGLSLIMTGTAGYEPPTVSIHRSSYRTIDEEEGKRVTGICSLFKWVAAEL